MDAEALKNLGNARKAAGDLAGAAVHYRMALRGAPDYVPALYNLGLVLRETGPLEEAERCFRRVHELDPRDAEALIHLADVLSAGAKFAPALEAARAALRLAPDNAYVWLQLAGAARARGDLRVAADAYARVIELEPAAAAPHNDLGNVLQEEGRVEEAIVHYRQAIRLEPGYAGAHSNLGCALVRAESLREAAAAFGEAIRLDASQADAYLNLGSVQALLGERANALASYQAALERRPDDAAIRECLLTELEHLCEWSRLEELCALQRRAALDPESRIAPFSLLSIPSTPAEQLACAVAFAGRKAAAMAGERRRLGAAAARRGERIVLGYLSADFREHAVAHLVAEVLELHDRRRFEVRAYSYGPDDRGPMRARLERACEAFVDVRGLAHFEAAARMRADGVGILVDLQGYTQHARTEIAALRPAPLAVSFLGYTGTMGADFIDYIVVDRFAAPDGAARHYTEKLVRLPGSFQANDRQRKAGATPARSALGLPERGFVFCCFNQSFKILPEVFASWMRLLGAVEGSVLWLLEANPWAKENLRREAARAGVRPERLVFAPFVPLEAHLGRMRAADLVVDTRPYGAHTTSSDALWVGVPVVTFPGETLASRVAGSLLTAMGAPELIAGSAAEYEALAIALARDPARLAALRAGLERNRASAALFDTPRYVRHLETAYERMWDRQLRDEAPAQIDL